MPSFVSLKLKEEEEGMHIIILIILILYTILVIGTFTAMSAAECVSITIPLHWPPCEWTLTHLSFSYIVLAISNNSPVLQSARPHAVALASYTGVDKIIKNTVGFTRKDIWIY